MKVDDRDEDRLAAGRAAFAAARWRDAFETLRRLDDEAPQGPEDLERVAESAMWLGEFQACIDHRQRAFAAFVEQGNTRRAARLAIELCIDHAARGRLAVATGWGQRAEHLLDGVEPCSETGWLAVLNAVVALYVLRDTSEAETRYAEALNIGRDCGDADLAAMAQVGLGTSFVRKGEVNEGLRLIDEAMTEAVTGELGAVATARVYCSTISLCQGLGDLRRALEWTDEAIACSNRPGMSDFPGDCRLHRAEITRLRGDWAGAESELHRVMAELERWDPAHVGQAWYELGEIALRRGDFEAARDAFDHATSYNKDPQPGLAGLRLAQGDATAAAALLRAAVANAGDADPLALGQLAPLMVEAQLAAGDVASAVVSSEQLTALAETYRTIVLEAQAAVARARVSLATGADNHAVVEARAAVSLWRDAGAPYEAAQAQHLLAAAANRSGDRSLAIVELDAALAVFVGLGATRDVEAVQQLRGRLGELEVAQRVRRTFMFTDIVDSTRLVAAMGDERWSAVLRWHDHTIRDLLAQHKGTEVKQRGGGDGFFAVFATPSNAVSCAVSIQQRFAEHRETSGFAPEVRIGVHEADALLSSNDFAGLGVHEAARIAELAGAGDIVASAATVETAGNPAATTAAAVALKGLADRMPVQHIVWAASSTHG